jgi:uncharacterized membrane protein
VSAPRRATPDEAWVPFAGLRRNARALLLGGLLLGGLWVLPDLTPPSADVQPLRLLHGRIVSLDPAAPADPAGGPAHAGSAQVLILDGPERGRTIGVELQGPSGATELPDYAIGDEIVVSVSQLPEGTFAVAQDRWRAPVLAGILALFAAAVTLVGGWRGVRSLIALALTLGVVVRVVVPLLLAGWDPVPLAVAAGTAVTVATFLLTEGWKPSTWAAAAGTFAALALTAALAAITTGLARFTPGQGDETTLLLQTLGRADLDIGGLLLAAVIFGTLGVLDDVTVTQAATIEELHRAEPSAPRLRLFARGMNVGRAHIGATVNTLFLAYAAASLPLLVLFAAGRQDPLLLASEEQVAVEVVRALVGSVGIVAAVPLTTALATLLVHRGDGGSRGTASG